ncbi:protein eceriferum 3 [Gossypium australe]|uniref:Protein eceriferum 3 n=1 Tax=Gossypium australe TaxID=47621 RepID=A0A5B6V126_9ROSI|nr:protein eceriferum 3 [Gossypium australe]
MKFLLYKAIIQLTQIKSHEEKKTKKSKAKIYLLAKNFYSNRDLQSNKGNLRLFQGRIRRWKDKRNASSEFNKGIQYAKNEGNNRVRLLGSKLFDSRIVPKNFVTITKKFDTTNTALLPSKATLAELLNAM